MLVHFSKFLFISSETNKHKEITFSAHDLSKKQKQMKQLFVIYINWIDFSQKVD